MTFKSTIFTNIFILSVLLVVSSCDDFLSIEPRQSISDELAIVDEPSLNTALRGAYRSLGNGGYYGGTYVLLGFVPSGNVEYQVFNNLQDLNFLPEDASFQGAWAAIYETINITNHIINKAPDLTDINLTEDERNKVLGEAYFIRALGYFDLARAFGGVPLKLTPTTDIRKDATLERSTLAQTYSQVLSDLDQAEALLPVSLNRVRATKTTVWALKARYYLYNRNWEKAIEFSSKVIALTDYTLVKPFNAWFKGQVSQTPESIFEIAYSAQNTNGLRTPMALQARGGEYRFRPTTEIVSALKAGGARIALLDSAKQNNTTLYAGSLYYRSPATDPSYILRLAEQYLIRAEARAQDEDLAGAVDDLNEVRSRADLTDTQATTQDQILDAILAERRLEFLWEAHRYFDLVRTGKLETEIEALKPNLNITEKHYLLPIPSNEEQLGGLEQNPLYN